MERGGAGAPMPAGGSSSSTAEGAHFTPLMVVSSGVEMPVRKADVEARDQTQRRLSSGRVRQQQPDRPWEKWVREGAVTATAKQAAAGHTAVFTHSRRQERSLSMPKAKLSILQSYQSADAIQQYCPPIIVQQQQTSVPPRRQSTGNQAQQAEHVQPPTDEHGTRSPSGGGGERILPSPRLIKRDDGDGASKVIYFQPRKAVHATPNAGKQAEGSWPTRRFTHRGPSSWPAPDRHGLQHRGEPQQHGQLGGAPGGQHDPAAQGAARAGPALLGPDMRRLGGGGRQPDAARLGDEMFVEVMKQMYNLPRPATSAGPGEGVAGRCAAAAASLPPRWLPQVNPAFDRMDGGAEEQRGGPLRLPPRGSRGSSAGGGAGTGTSSDSGSERVGGRRSGDFGLQLGMLPRESGAILQTRPATMHSPRPSSRDPGPEAPQPRQHAPPSYETPPSPWESRESRWEWDGADEDSARPESADPAGAMSQLDTTWRAKGAGYSAITDPPPGSGPPLPKDVTRAMLRSRGGGEGGRRAAPRRADERRAESTACMRPTWGGSWMYGMGGADRGADTGKPAVKSRLKTGDFALEGSAAARRSAEERLQEINCRALSSWAEDGTCWRADPAEEELPIFDAPATTADTRVASRRQRYLYKDVISVVPSSEELEAMREVQEESEQAEERYSVQLERNSGTSG
eukprot:jgi/Tetstr1/423852/TSEL_014478.t1